MEYSVNPPTMQSAQEDPSVKAQEKLLTPRDVADILDCSPNHVIQLARTGKIQVAPPGRFWRFHHADVMAYRQQLGPCSSPEE